MQTVEYTQANGIFSDLLNAVNSHDFASIAFIINMAHGTTGYVKMSAIWEVIEACTE